MPNWCHNRVSFYSDNEQDINKLYEIFTSENVFNKILPSPDWKNIPNENGELPRTREMKNSKDEVVATVQEFPDGTQDARWYDWQIEHWGTKWDVDPECDHFESDSFECTFDTAWSPPEGIYNELRKRFPDVSISWFYDEPGMQVAGYL